MRLHFIFDITLAPLAGQDWRAASALSLQRLRDGLEALNRFPELKISMGGTWSYEQVRKWSPECFQQLLREVAAGRWEVTNGGYAPSHHALLAPGTLLRQYQHSQRYAQQHLKCSCGVVSNAVTPVHPDFTPELLSALGLAAYAGNFGRKTTPPVFRWTGPSGISVVAANLNAAPDFQQRLQDAWLTDSDLTNRLVLCTTPDRDTINQVVAFRRAHPDIQCTFSTYGDFFQALQKDDLQQLPCITQLPQETVHHQDTAFARTFARTETTLAHAEFLAHRCGVINTQKSSLAGLWKSLFFCGQPALVDGTATPAVLEEQLDALAAVRHTANALIFSAARAVMDAANTTPPAGDHFVFNPTPFAQALSSETTLPGGAMVQCTTVATNDNATLRIFVSDRHPGNGAPIDAAGLEITPADAVLAAWEDDGTIWLWNPTADVLNVTLSHPGRKVVRRTLPPRAFTPVTLWQ